MLSKDLKQFRNLMTATLEYYDKQATPMAIDIYWEALKAYPIDVVQQFLNAHINTSKFMPKVSEIHEAIMSMDGRPAPQEAWAMLAASLNNEGQTVVWTDEMATAFGVALGLQDDSVGARMAFLESYKGAVASARRTGAPLKWTASLGHNVAGREGPLLEAVQRGRLPKEHVARLLPSHLDPSGDVVKLLEMVDSKKRIGK